MEHQTRVREQMEALAGVLACAVSLVEDIRQALGGKTGTKNAPHLTEEAIYVMGRLAGIISKQAHGYLKEAKNG